MALGRAGRGCLRGGQVGLGTAPVGLRGGRGRIRGGRQVGLGRWGLRRGRLGGRQVGLRRGRRVVRGWRLRRGHVGLGRGHIGAWRHRGRCGRGFQLHGNQTGRPVSLVVQHLVLVLLRFLIAEGRPRRRGHRRRRRLLPVSVAAPGHHRRGRRKVMGWEHALHLLLVNLLQLLELSQVLFAEAHEARG